MDWLKRIFDFLSPKFAPGPSVQPRDDAKKIALLLSGYIEEAGGVASVLKRFEAAGYASKTRSWTSDGPMRAINSVEALQLIGWKDLRALSAKFGAPVDQLRDMVAEALPTAIRKAARQA